MLISVVVTVRNEARGMPRLLDSLLVQEKPFEIIIVDAKSSDDTPKIVKEYASKHKEIKLFSYDHPRGKSRNYGVKHSKGKVVAFTDGSCVVGKNWLKEIRKTISKGYDVVAGKTVKKGMKGFSHAKRVSIYHNGGDASFPTCNIAYKKTVFNKIGGFDTWFKEAEDIDINYRALDSGAKIKYNMRMLVYHYGAEKFNSFLKKSFWYGFGRKEINIRHGSMWSEYNMFEMLQLHEGESMWKYVRYAIAALGYVFCSFVGHKTEKKEQLRQARFHSH